MTCILISTFDRYESLARWTAGRIDREWAGHPPVYYAGLSRRDEQSLGFEGDAADWMDVNRQAVVRLRGMGFTRAYLVLDDHPPVGRCHADYLSRILPEHAERLGAAYVGLLGYGQHRCREGNGLGAEWGHLEHTPASYRWKFSLHPGLWSLADLQVLLESRMETYPAGQRSPWNFERHRDVPGDARVDALAGRCYRVCGSAWMEGGAAARALGFEAALRFVADVALFVARLRGGQQARNRAELRRLWMYGHYLGPYPLFWSGTMRQGRPHADFEKWLENSGPRELRTAWAEISSDCHPT